jgi:hypothetical protein
MKNVEISSKSMQGLKKALRAPIKKGRGTEGEECIYPVGMRERPLPAASC